MFINLNELASLQKECLSAYGEDGPQDVAEFKQCRDLAVQWMQKAKDAMVTCAEQKGMYMGPQTYAQSTGRPIRDGSTILTRMADADSAKAYSFCEDARNLLAQMRLRCLERFKIELDDL